jgi:hypothetical protein
MYPSLPPESSCEESDVMKKPISQLNHNRRSSLVTHFPASRSTANDDDDAAFIIHHKFFFLFHFSVRLFPLIICLIINVSGFLLASQKRMLKYLLVKPAWISLVKVKTQLGLSWDLWGGGEEWVMITGRGMLHASDQSITLKLESDELKHDTLLPRGLVSWL